MNILAGDGAADRGRMNTNLFSNLFDHHGLELINSLVQKLPLTTDGGLTNFQDRLPALLDVLD